jgi:4-amino-4-deoxy-L-arabinose transferase-like glycosyltransferase
MNFTTKFHNYFIQILIVIFASLLFIPFLGSVHLFDWDEINFAEAAREMIASKNYLTVQINYQPFWEKPPLFIWLQVISMKTFGINEFSARFPNAVCGIVTLLVLFNTGKIVYDTKFGILWALTYCCSILPLFYFKSGIIDPWFNLFIFLGIYFIIQYSKNYDENIFKTRYIIFSAFFIGLGILTKGPVALLIFSLTYIVFLIFNKFRLSFRLYDLLIFILIVCVVGGFWFILQIINGHFNIVESFIIYQLRLLTTKDAGHGGFFGYHFIVLFAGVFPASVFALNIFKSNSNDSFFQKFFRIWMIILFWVVLLLFSLVKTKIIHYSSLCYFPLTFLGACFIYMVLKNEIRFTKLHFYLTIAIGALWGLSIVLLQLANNYKTQIISSGLIKDIFALENFKANVSWSGYEYIIGLITLAGLILSVILYTKNKYFQSILTILISSLFLTSMTIIFIVPKIEQYTQNAPIEFYKKIQNEDCYVETLGFKSYAHLFYSQKKYNGNKIILGEDSLLNGKINKNAYFVTKISKKTEYIKKFNLIEIYEKNGFVFLVRYPDSK